MFKNPIPHTYKNLLDVVFEMIISVVNNIVTMVYTAPSQIEKKKRRKDHSFSHSIYNLDPLSQFSKT